MTLTAILSVMSSVNFVIKHLVILTGEMPLNSDNDNEQNGTQYSSLGDAFVDVDPFCWDHQPQPSVVGPAVNW